METQKIFKITLGLLLAIAAGALFVYLQLTAASWEPYVLVTPIVAALSVTSVVLAGKSLRSCESLVLRVYAVGVIAVAVLVILPCIGVLCVPMAGHLIEHFYHLVNTGRW